jgi:hypothetical protein
MLPHIPPPKTQIKSTHEGSFTVDQTEFLMVSPIQNNAFVHSIHSLEGITGEFRDTGGVQGQVLQRGKN